MKNGSISTPAQQGPPVLPAPLPLRPPLSDSMPISEFARRAGVAASALRFYEAQGLMHSQRRSGGQRQFARGDLRRVAFIRAAQAVGLTLDDIRTALHSLPDQRTPTARDWERLSSRWRPMLDDRIAALTRLRDQLASCIGCGCLSLKRCALYNPQDIAATRGSGARYLLGDRSAEVMAGVQTRPENLKG